MTWADLTWHGRWESWSAHGRKSLAYILPGREGSQGGERWQGKRDTQGRKWRWEECTREEVKGEGTREAGGDRERHLCVVGERSLNKLDWSQTFLVYSYIQIKTLVYQWTTMSVRFIWNLKLIQTNKGNKYWTIKTSDKQVNNEWLEGWIVNHFVHVPNCDFNYFLHCP